MKIDLKILMGIDTHPPHTGLPAQVFSDETQAARRLCCEKENFYYDCLLSKIICQLLTWPWIEFQRYKMKNQFLFLIKCNFMVRNPQFHAHRAQPIEPFECLPSDST